MARHAKTAETTAKNDDRAEKIRAIQEDLNAKVSALRSSEEWIAALEVAAKFYRYSANNILLLLLQAEKRGIALSKVAGYRAWQALGRQVKGGEKGLQILAPARYKIDDPKNPGEKKWIVKGFTVAHVWDFSQTEGDDLPECAPELLVLGGEQPLLDRAVALIEGRGFTFQLAAPGSTFLGSANGVTNYDDRCVIVRNDVSLAQTIKTTIHELAHVLLHDPATGLDYRANRERCEVEAESVAYVVLTHFGIDADEYSIPYVAGWSESKPETVKAAAEVVFQTARQVIDDLLGDVAQEVAA